MAYGKIKADTLVYDNSGSDAEVTISSLGSKASTADPTFTGNVTINARGDLRLADSDSSNYVGFEAPGTVTSNIVWTLPAADGTDGQLLKTNGSNVLSWVDDSALSIIDEDDMATNSNTRPPSQQSVKAYVDLKAPIADPTFTGTVTCSNLTVNGTTTTVNSATLTVDDKNIELGSVDTPSDTTADGGGITLKGATDKTITWTNATDTWDFNQNIKITTGSLNIVGIEGGPSTINLDADEGDDNADIWRIQAGTSGSFTISTYSTGSYVDAISLNSLGDATFVGNVSDSKGGLRDIPVVGKSSAYTLVATDAGKAIYISSGGVTVPASVLSGGKVVTILNDSGSDQTITQGSGFTLYNAADATTGNRTLAGRGMATILFTGTTAGYISGAGLS